VRCNFNSNVGDNNQGISGLSDNSGTSYVEARANEPFCKSINATAGESYLIVVENLLQMKIQVTVHYQVSQLILMALPLLLIIVINLN
jgi:hypothetical protein